MIKFTGDLRCDFEKAAAEIEKQKDRILGYQEKIAGLRESVKKLKKSKEKDKKQYQESLAEKDAVIKELQNRLAHAEALLNHDGSNTGTPTSQTPISKNKPIPSQKVDKRGTKSHPLRNRKNLMLQIPLDTLCKTMSAVQNAALLTVRPLANLKSNMNTMSA